MNTITNIDDNPNQNLIDPQTQTQTQTQTQSHTRRPRGFAATAAASANSNSSAGKAKKEREKEKERTKLRERHRRAITSRMLAGLRQYGNFPLPARADMNDVLAALAREAGWTVEADGSTYRQSPPLQQMASFPVRSVESPVSANNCSVKAAVDSVLRIDESLSPASLDSVVIADRDSRTDKFTSVSPINSVECLEADQLIQDVRSVDHENDFTGTPYVPVYVMLANGVINNFCQLVDPEGVRQELSHMKSLHVDGIIVNCWWGIVEGWTPQKYAWSGYRELFNIIREYNLKLQVVMAFHEYGANDSGDVLFSLPQWVLEIGKGNQDIFFTDREGRRNTECLSWGIDKERVLNGRTGIEVYFDFMRSFRTEFDDFFALGLISAVEIGLGPSGELRYPSYPDRMGWRYPGIGEFQCYDKYLQQNLRKAARLRGHSFWARGPDNADNVLSLASLAFEETKLVIKVPAVYWWYKTASHAAELTAGYYNPRNQDGYFPVFEVLKKHSVTMKLVCSGLQVSNLEGNEGLADPEGLSWQVLNLAWDRGLTVAGENALSCYDREGCMRIVEMAKPRNDPDHRHFSFFVYQQPTSLLQGTICFSDLDYFIKCMHGDMGDLLV
ncbi:hypothetical protein LWI29_021158 [Acer saccharum]|uniref:Beta-amylase n=1 Tax=Acer saccharum TaxID=4024 RepID=A0AA39VLC5_ACESA|nr:hypothetical protein LWI29_021158 [Acer saccharum]